MTQESSHGASTRTPVFHGGRRIPGLHQRTLKDGATVFEARLRIDGKDTRVVLDATTKTDAVREYQGLRVDRDRGDVKENRLINPTVREVCDELLERMRIRIGIQDERLRIAPRTVEQYEGTFRLRIPAWLARKRIADVDIVDIRRFVDTLTARGFAPSSATGTISNVTRLFAFAMKQGYVDRNVVRDLDSDERPGSKRLTEPRYLTETEIKRLLDAAEPRYRPVFACCAYAGLRNGEVRGLQWGDIDFDEGRIRIKRQANPAGDAVVPTKTFGSQASVPMFPALRRELLAHRQWMAEQGIATIHPDRFVFVRTSGPGTRVRNLGRPLNQQLVRDGMARAGTRAGLNTPGVPPVTLHDLRHSFVALAIENGATLPEAAELARHSAPETTLRVYAGLTKDGRDKAAAKLLDAGFGV